MLQSRRSQRVRHDLVTEQRQQNFPNFWISQTIKAEGENLEIPIWNYQLLIYSIRNIFYYHLHHNNFVKNKNINTEYGRYIISELRIIL